MAQNFKHDVHSKFKRKRRRKAWQKIVNVMMCVVVFCTTYALILPAITMETDSYCGIAPHTHAEECFQNQLLCDIHVHTDECYRMMHCTLPETEGHSHTEECVSQAESTLSCDLEENPGHTHTEECDPQTEITLVCEQEVSSGHSHTEECFLTEQTLSCTLEQTEGHSHDSQCYTNLLTCELAEDENHTHEAACFSSQLSCGQAEQEAHSHSESCFSTVTTNICTQEEQEGHSHNDDCYTAITTYGCNMEQSEGHIHTDDCTTPITTYSCGLEEQEPHTHTQECFTTGVEPMCGIPADDPHEHGEDCYGQQLICQLEEHEHSLICYANPEADLETPEIWERTLPGQLSGDLRADLLAVARSQLGYAESTGNYIVPETGGTRGYTRYGAWYGNPYGEWNAMFVSFCLHYAQADVIPPSDSCSGLTAALQGRGLYQNAADYTPQPGDLVFFSRSANGQTDHVGIVTDYIPATEHAQAQLKTIEGDSSDVVRYMVYNQADPAIVGYGTLTVPEVTETIPATEEENPSVITKTAVIYTDGSYTSRANDATFITLTGIIPEDAEVRAFPVTLNNDYVVCAYDITIFLPDGTVFEPTPDQEITVHIQSPSIPEEDVEVYYHPDEGTPEKVDSTVTEEGIVFDTNHFSTYAVYALGDKYDLGTYVTAVSIQRRGENQLTWEPVVNNTVYVGDELRFNLRYYIPEKILDASHRVVTYNLPVDVTKKDSGFVYQGEEIVGTYNISENGVITITFNEDYAVANGGGADISGFIAFETSVDDLELDDSGGTNLAFKENVHIQVEGIENVTNDLQVTKQASNAKVTEGTVDYTIVVTSEKGTGSEVLLTDVMTGIQADGAITVRNKNGNVVNNVTTSNTANGFSMTLPKMGAGDSYTITYKAKIPNAQNLNGTVDANNKVSVSSTDRNNNKLVDHDDVDTHFERNVLEKSGSLNGDVITWTVKINTSRVDIGGWVLSDVMNGTEHKGNVTISPAPPNGNGSTTVKLPYTFPSGSNRTYTVTYQTKVDSNNIGNTNYNNTAVLNPPGDGNISAGVNVTTKDYNPLDKTAAGVQISGQLPNGTKVADFRWTVTISASEGDIVPYAQSIHGQSQTVWFYGDEPWNENRHWLTGAQLKELDANLKANYSGNYTIYAYVWNGTGNKYQTPTPLSQVSDAARYGQFRILFYDTLYKGQKIQFQYSSSVDIGDGTNAVSVTNWGTVNGKASDQVEQYYRPIVTKVDKKGSGATTEHLLGNTTLKGYPGVLGWNVDVTIPMMTHTSNLVIIEDIPDGTELLSPASGEWSLSFALNNFSNHNFNFGNGTTATLSSNGYTVVAQKFDGHYTITIPKEMANAYAGQTIRMEVRVQIKEDFDWDQAYKSFENKVIVTSGGTELGSATQTQIIHNPVLNKASGAISNNTIPYILDINPQGKDLLPGVDTMTLTDVLQYKDPATGALNATLVIESVTVYRINADGSQQDITAQCPFTFSESTLNDENRKVIKMTLPDNVPLRIQYSYRITGTIGVGTDLNNYATIEGLGQSLDDVKHNIKVTVEQSNAGAIMLGVKIVKVDAGNYVVRLKGAKFNLEKWNGSAFVVVAKFETSDNGTYLTGELEADTAYQLVEVDSPHGYAIDPSPYQFYIVGSGTNLSAPAGFAGKPLNNNDSVFIPNEKRPYLLPETGGAGTHLYTMAGLLLMLTSAAYLTYSTNPRRREDI